MHIERYFKLRSIRYDLCNRLYRSYKKILGENKDTANFRYQYFSISASAVILGVPTASQILMADRFKLSFLILIMNLLDVQALPSQKEWARRNA